MQLYSCLILSVGVFCVTEAREFQSPKRNLLKSPTQSNLRRSLLNQLPQSRVRSDLLGHQVSMTCGVQVGTFSHIGFTLKLRLFYF